MKPLTIEELKALEVGDWVWLVRWHEMSDYAIITSQSEDRTQFHSVTTYSNFEHSSYGTKWLAYKNKEQAEAKGKIVELPEPFIDTDKNSYGQTTYSVYRSRVAVSCPVEDIYTDKSKAERRLAELKGEEK